MVVIAPNPAMTVYYTVKHYILTHYTLTSDVKIDGFPLSNMFSSSSLVVTLPAKTINGKL